MQFLERVPDNSRPQMPDVEGLGDIRGGIIQHDYPALPDVGRAVVLLLLQDAGNQSAQQVRTGKVNIQVPVDGFGTLHAVAADAGGEGVCDLHRGAAQDTGKLEARQGDIAHGGVGGVFQQVENVGLGQRRDTLRGNRLYAAEDLSCQQLLDLQHHTVGSFLIMS